MQITLQLRASEADVLTRMALSERRTARRQAEYLLAEALARQAKEAKEQEATLTR